MKPSFKAVFFDLDGTLRIPSPSPTEAFISFARTLNVQIDPISERRVKLWAHAYWGRDKIVQQDMERFDTDGFWINYSRLLLETVEARQNLQKRAKLVREWFDGGYDPHVTLAPGTITLLSILKEQGYKLGVISNRSQPFHHVLQQLGIANYFDYTLAAGEIGIWKPNPQIFAHSIAQFDGLKASECIYIGDNYHADGIGAKAAGLYPVLYDPDVLYEMPHITTVQNMREILAFL